MRPDCFCSFLLFSALTLKSLPFSSCSALLLLLFCSCSALVCSRCALSLLLLSSCLILSAFVLHLFCTFFILSRSVFFCYYLCSCLVFSYLTRSFLLGFRSQLRHQTHLKLQHLDRFCHLLAHPHHVLVLFCSCFVSPYLSSSFLRSILSPFVLAFCSQHWHQTHLEHRVLMDIVISLLIHIMNCNFPRHQVNSGRSRG